MLTTLTLVVLQVQLAAELKEMEKKVEVTLKPRHKFQLEMAKLLLFDRDPGNIAGFVIVYKLYIRIRIREKIVKK